MKNGHFQAAQKTLPPHEVQSNRFISLKTTAYGYFEEIAAGLCRSPSRSRRRWLRQVGGVDWSFDCCLCHEPEDSGAICGACQRLLVKNKLCCRLCACPMDSPDSNDEHTDICEVCSIIMPPFVSATVPYLYRFPVDELVMLLKYRDSPGMARVMAALMADAVRVRLQERSEKAQADVDFLVPVPLLPARFRQRGFNQSMQLCRGLSSRLNIPVHATALLRSVSPELQGQVDGARSQTELDRQARMENLSYRHAGFKAAGVSGLNLMLVDDVMTTGATLNAASEALLAAGARSVRVCAFARTPP